MKRIYVCTRSLAENLRLNNAALPPIVVRVDNGPERYFHKVEVDGPTVARWDPKGAHGDGQGPHIWVETEYPVMVFDNLDEPYRIL